METKWISTILIGALMLIGFGCATAKHEQEFNRAMMIQENRQLEDQLFVVRNELSRAVQENQSLRTQMTQLQSSSKQTVSPSVPPSQNRPTSQTGNVVPTWSPYR